MKTLAASLSILTQPGVALYLLRGVAFTCIISVLGVIVGLVLGSLLALARTYCKKGPARIRQLLSAAGTYNGLGTVNVSDVMVLFGAACVIYFIINFTLSCIVRSMQNKRKKAIVFAPAKAA